MSADRNPDACAMEGRARSLRRLASQMDEVSADAFRRRASALELLAFVHRCRSATESVAHHGDNQQVRPQVKVDQVA